MKRPKNEVVADLDVIMLAVQKRMVGVDQCMLGLLPAESDWMTGEELEQVHKLKLELPSHGEERAAAIERLQAKRLARTK